MDMDLMIVQQQLEEQKNLINSTYRREANAKIKYVALKYQEKNMLAILITQQVGKSMVEKKNAARASKEWDTFIKGLISAEQEFIKATANVKSLEGKIKILQSQNKNHLT